MLEPGASWTVPAAKGEDTVRVLYVFDGAGVDVRNSLGDGDVVTGSTGVVVDSQQAVTLIADGHVELLVMQGRPIGEPVAQEGPFVMNTDEELRQAFADYRRTEFGGWPFPDEAPHHGRDAGRFARHADGREEQRGTAQWPAAISTSP